VTIAWCRRSTIPMRGAGDERLGHVLEDLSGPCNFRLQGVDTGLLCLMRNIAHHTAERTK
jgi:hypothetical protein